MIATIVLDINGVKIELTQAQAKELHKLLGSLTGKDMVEYVWPWLIAQPPSTSPTETSKA